MLNLKTPIISTKLCKTYMHNTPRKIDLKFIVYNTTIIYEQ
jgi:hypothetical protein